MEELEIRCSCGKVYRASSLMRGQKVPCSVCGRPISREVDGGPPLAPPSVSLHPPMIMEPGILEVDPLPLPIETGMEEESDEPLEAIASAIARPKAAPRPVHAAPRPARTAATATSSSSQTVPRVCVLFLCSLGILFAGGAVIVIYTFWLPNAILFDFSRLAHVRDVQIQINGRDLKPSVIKPLIPLMCTLGGTVLGFVSLHFAQQFSVRAELGIGVIRSLQRAALLLAIAWIGFLIYSIYKHGLYEEIEIPKWFLPADGSVQTRYFHWDLLIYPLPAVCAWFASGMIGAMEAFAPKQRPPGRELHIVNVTWITAVSAGLLVLLIYLTDPAYDLRRFVEQLQEHVRQLQEQTGHENRVKVRIR